jgi:sugar phosphate isomerase/epimerase
MHPRIGVLTSLKPQGSNFQYVAGFGLRVCQLCCWNPDLYTQALAQSVRKEADELGIQITSLWGGWPGPAVWDFVDGPGTLGLVPRAHRAPRIDALRKAGEFASQAGLAAVVTHLGFIPENPRDPMFGEIVEVVRDLALYYQGLGLQFWFETGQETPTTMLRLIQEAGTGNLGINLDPANLILYGKGNPIDALDVFGPWVRSIHAKDGCYPTDPMKLGEEMQIGAGRVRFPELIRRLKEVDYRGAFIIEREISGPQQAADIAESIEYLGALIG